MSKSITYVLCGLLALTIGGIWYYLFTKVKEADLRTQNVITAINDGTLLQVLVNQAQALQQARNASTTP